MDFEKFLRYRLPVLAWALAILYVSTMPGKAVAPISGGIPYSSAVAHFGEFLVFSLLLHRALAHEALSAKRALMMTIIISFAYSSITEILQLYVPGRFFDYNDILTNDFGAVAGLARSIYIRII